jgi:hypothetical protein
MDLKTTKEEPKVLKVKLPDDTCLNMPIYSRGNTEEYLAHIVAVLSINKQKGLDARCRKLGKTVVKLFKTPGGCWVKGHCLVGHRRRGPQGGY